MARTLLVTNDFPPRPGGIQSYLHALAMRLPADELVVLASTWGADPTACAPFDAAQPFEIHRLPVTMMLPSAGTVRCAVALARSRRIDTAWFGAAAPLGLMAPVLRRRAGVQRVLASAHGHEIGWSMLPGARTALQRIGRAADVVTTVSRYTRGRLAAALGPTAALEPVPPGIDTTAFRPDPDGRAAIRRRYRLGGRPVVGCVSRLVRRKGQDVLVAALDRIRTEVPGAALMIAGHGPDADRLRRLAREHGVADDVVFTGAVAADEVAAHHAALDVFALPCRTLGGGLDVEGLGIVLLEASATGVVTVAGRAGGAPETVRPGQTGCLADGRDAGDVAATVAGLLADPDRAARMGAAGRRWMRAEWTWEARAARIRALTA